MASMLVATDIINKIKAQVANKPFVHLPTSRISNTDHYCCRLTDYEQVHLTIVDKLFSKTLLNEIVQPTNYKQPYWINDAVFDSTSEVDKKTLEEYLSVQHMFTDNAEEDSMNSDDDSAIVVANNNRKDFADMLYELGYSKLAVYVAYKHENVAVSWLHAIMNWFDTSMFTDNDDNVFLNMQESFGHVLMDHYVQFMFFTRYAQGLCVGNAAQVFVNDTHDLRTTQPVIAVPIHCNFVTFARIESLPRSEARKAMQRIVHDHMSVSWAKFVNDKTDNNFPSEQNPQYKELYTLCVIAMFVPLFAQDAVYELFDHCYTNIKLLSQQTHAELTINPAVIVRCQLVPFAPTMLLIPNVHQAWSAYCILQTLPFPLLRIAITDMKLYKENVNLEHYEIARYCFHPNTFRSLNATNYSMDYLFLATFYAVVRPINLRSDYRNQMACVPHVYCKLKRHYDSFYKGIQNIRKPCISLAQLCLVSMLNTRNSSVAFFNSSLVPLNADNNMHVEYLRIKNVMDKGLITSRKELQVIVDVLQASSAVYLTNECKECEYEEWYLLNQY